MAHVPKAYPPGGDHVRKDVGNAPQADAPIQALLPDELLLHILSLLPVRSLATACCVCQQWRQLGDSQVSILSLAPLQLVHLCCHPRVLQA
jgi:F-box-like